MLENQEESTISLLVYYFDDQFDKELRFSIDVSSFSCVSLVLCAVNHELSNLHCEMIDPAKWFLVNQ